MSLAGRRLMALKEAPKGDNPLKRFSFSIASPLKNQAFVDKRAMGSSIREWIKLLGEGNEKVCVFYFYFDQLNITFNCNFLTPFE